MNDTLTKANQALQEQIVQRKRAENQFRALLEFTPDPIVIVNRDGIIVLVNVQAVRVFGYAQGDMLGKPIEMLVPESFRGAHPAHRAEYTAEPHVRGMGVGLELYALRKDGSQFPVEISLSPIETEEGVLIASAIRDITERKRIEEALRESERRWRLLVQNSPDVIYILDLISERTTYLNRTEFLGYTQSELEAPGGSATVHPDDQEIVVAHWYKVTGEGGFQGVGSIEYRLQDKAGQWQWIQSRETILTTSENGKPAQLLVTLSIITERKQAEAALRESEEQYRALFNQLEDTILIHDEQGNLLDVNQAACERLGYSRDELLRMKTVDIDAPEYGAKFYDRLEHQLGTGKLLDIEGVHIARDGRAIPVHVHSRSITFKGQTAVLAVARDVTELKRAEQQAVELASERTRVKILADFIRDASHDFRTPLTSIGADAYLLLHATDEEKRQRYFQRIELQVKRMSHLMDRQLLMARLDAGGDFDFQDVNLVGLLRIVRDRFLPVAQKRGVGIVWQVKELLPVIRADEQDLSRALAELLDNAIAFTPEDGTVTIRANTSEKGVTISIQDTGIGIAPEDLPHIFERLYRADHARSTERGAVGLGLSIAKQIIELHHGTITVESVVGEGSTFRIFLPLG
jgi:PAS domain S-box-containing protein